MYNHILDSVSINADHGPISFLWDLLHLAPRALGTVACSGTVSKSTKVHGRGEKNAVLCASHIFYFN